MLSAFWLNITIKFLSLCLIQYGTGSLVFHKDMKVNYTRKINHFALFFIPMLLDKIIPYGKSMELFILGYVLIICTLIIYIQPVRSRVPIIRRMFLSFDRPEDRPYTMTWVSTQIIAGYLVIIPALSLFIKSGYSHLIFIPVLINGIGDGLAEPVGIRFGKHKYKTKALFSKREYERSLEGSSCVFITSVIILFLFHSSFSNVEFIWALIVLPLAMTIAEAFSPHTWDTPFLFLTGYTILYFIKSVPF
jgi:dolichol kinase